MRHFINKLLVISCRRVGSIIKQITSHQTHTLDSNTEEYHFRTKTRRTWSRPIWRRTVCLFGRWFRVCEKKPFSGKFQDPERLSNRTATLTLLLTTGFPRILESHWKYLNFFLLNSRPCKYLKTGQVLQSPRISFHRSLKVLEFTKSNCAISETSLNRCFA